ncbi:Tn3 family transposase [Streptosporangium sp. CA-115845]|uniref:Tn3 family transposase n=1 Tax=Streptosporangium sp. CA-115845 TaxID=3240071 RepID=UPI003D8ACB88
MDETYRRDIKHIRNLQENRHSLARKICHGKKGELHHRYERGLENQLGALGLVLNCATLWTTVYLDAAVRQLKVQGYPVREEDMARLSPFVHSHLGVHGTYTFALPDLAPAPSATCATPTPPKTTRSDQRGEAEGGNVRAMTDTPDSAPATYEDLMRQTRRIYQELERYHGITRRQLKEERKTVEAAIYVALDTDDESGQVVGQAALDAAQQIRARWIPASDNLQ